MIIVLLVDTVNINNNTNDAHEDINNNTINIGFDFQSYILKKIFTVFLNNEVTVGFLTKFHTEQVFFYLPERRTVLVVLRLSFQITSITTNRNIERVCFSFLH